MKIKMKKGDGKYLFLLVVCVVVLVVIVFNSKDRLFTLIGGSEENSAAAAAPATGVNNAKTTIKIADASLPTLQIYDQLYSLNKIAYFHLNSKSEDRDRSIFRPKYTQNLQKIKYTTYYSAPTDEGKDEKLLNITSDCDKSLTGGGTTFTKTVDDKAPVTVRDTKKSTEASDLCNELLQATYPPTDLFVNSGSFDDTQNNYTAYSTAYTERVTIKAYTTYSLGWKKSLDTSKPGEYSVVISMKADVLKKNTDDKIHITLTKKGDLSCRDLSFSLAPTDKYDNYSPVFYGTGTPNQCTVTVKIPSSKINNPLKFIPGTGLVLVKEIKVVSATFTPTNLEAK